MIPFPDLLNTLDEFCIMFCAKSDEIGLRYAVAAGSP